MSEPVVIEAAGRCGRLDRHDPHAPEHGSIVNGVYTLYRTRCGGEPPVTEGGYQGDPG